MARALVSGEGKLFSQESTFRLTIKKGGVIYPIVFHRLQPIIGFGWTTRILGFMTLATFLVAINMKQKSTPAEPRKLFDARPFREPAFVFFTFTFFFGFMGACKLFLARESPGHTVRG